MSSTSPSPFPNSPAVDPVPPASNSPPRPSSPPPNPSNSPPSAPPPQPNSPPPGAPPPHFNSPPSESATILPPQSNSPPPRAPPPQPNLTPVVSPPLQSPATPPPLMAATPPTSPPSPPPNVPPPTSPPSPPPNVPPNVPPPTSPPSPAANVPPPISPPVPPNPPISSPPPQSPPQPNPPTSSPPPQPPPNSLPPQSPTQPSPPPDSPPPRSPPQLNPPATSPPHQSPPRPSPPPRSPPPSPPFDPPSSPSPPSSPPSPPSSPPASPEPPNTAPPPNTRPPESSPPTPSTRPSPNSPPRQNPATPPLNLPPSTSPPSNSSPVQPPPRPPSNVPLPPRSPPSTILTPPANSGNNNSSNNAPASSQSSSGGSSGIGTGGTIAIVVTLSLLLLGVFGIAACCVWKRKKKVSRHNAGYILPTSVGSSPKSDSGLLKLQILGQNNGSGSGNVSHSPHEPGGLGNSRSWFAFEELVEATNGFSQQNLLGEGGFGAVYKGCLPDGMEVAVKQLKIGGGQGEREFKSEVEIISRIHHRHLVSLVGYCISDEKRLLVYDYLPNNTLYFHLHGKDRPVMDWDKRVKIAVGAARGIAYLHEDCNPRIIHRDIKSSNILLDNNFEAKVSDFGLAKLAMDANTHVTTRVMGTFGYMAPEYASSGKLTEKSDVYSFGVVLLELITGRKPVDTSQPLGEESIVEWARPLFSHALETHDLNALADPKLDGNYVDSEMFRLIEAAAACVRHSSMKRPKMSQVVRAFDSIVVSDLTNGMKVGESEIFNSAQQSEEIRFFRRMAFGSQNYSTDFFSQNSSSGESKPEKSLRETH